MELLENEVLGTVTYVIDDIEYKSNLLAMNDVQQQPNYWIFIVGFVILFLGIILLRIKPKKKKKARMRNRI